MTCRYCGASIVKAIIGWAHVWPSQPLHIARPKVGRKQ